MKVAIIGKNGVEDRSAGLTELLEEYEYKGRLARHRQEMFERRKEQDDSAELWL